MNALKKAIRSALVGDTQISSQVSGVYYRLAPQGTEPPYVLFQMVVGWDTYTFTRRAFSDYDFIVKAIVSSPDSTRGPAEIAGDIMERVDTVLTDSTALSVSGYKIGQIRRMRTFEYDTNYADIQIKYDYIQSGEVFAHSGAAFRVSLIPTS